MAQPLVSVIVPSFNQGRFLDAALSSIFRQDVPVEVFVMDGGSTDDSQTIIERWRPRLAGARSGPDDGQAAAINEGMAQASAPFVCWLNSDDLLLDKGLAVLLATLKQHPQAPAAYGKVWNVDELRGSRHPVWVQPFSEPALASRCIISQPGTLMRRSAWEAVGGLDASLHMALDYDLWWRLYRRFGELAFADSFVAVNRDHGDTKTRRFRRAHYREAIDVVRRHSGRVPVKWWLYQPYAVWFKSLRG
jgi:glycosyltransferase involved in cell wall biosynthesis